MNPKIALARRYYHHVLHGGTLTPEDVGRMVVALEELAAINEELKDKLTKQSEGG